MLNNFLHDFSAAGWLFGSVLLWQLLNRLPSTSPSEDPTLLLVLNTTRWLMRWSVVGIVVFGIIRMAAYREYEWNEAAGDSQITLLIVKHVLLTFVFLYGVIYYRRAGARLKQGAQP